MKRFYSLFILTFLSLILCESAAAQEFYVNNSDGVELCYVILNNADVEFCEPEDTSVGANLVIPAWVEYGGKSYKVTSIGEYALADYDDLSSISIPSTVTSIEEGAISGCSRLTSINIPQGVTTIGAGAFDSCSSLVSIELPRGVTSIGEEAFLWCESLTSIEIPKGVTSIGEAAFYGCASLESITIPNTVTEIGEQLFVDCEKLKEIKVAMYDKGLKPVFDSAITHCYTLSPLKYYLQTNIEPIINAWQLKGEFEKTSDWQERVNEKTREAKICKLMDEYSGRYFDRMIAEERASFADNSLELMMYDADNETFLVKISSMGDVLLPVPIRFAQEFKEDWEKIKRSAVPTFVPSGESVVLSALTFRDGSRKFTYDSKTRAQYQITEIDYNFEPIDVGGTVLASSGDGIVESGEVARKKIEAGKSDVDVNIPTTRRSSDKTFVVIIANENYVHEKAVDYAINDGRIFNQYCQKTLGVPAQNIHMLENATFGNMVSEVNWLESVLKQIGSDAKAIFYYSGHGIPNEATGDAYLLPTDCANSNYQTAYSLSDLYSALGGTSCASVTYFIDACFSGAERSGEMMASARGVAIKAKAGSPVGNSVLFSAASSDQTASAYNEKGHGIFTYFLLKKLQQSKGKASYGEIADYIAKHVGDISTIKNQRQTPNVVSSAKSSASWRGWRL